MAGWRWRRPCATGLPVWVGLSARTRDGTLMSYRDDGPAFADLVRHYAAQPIGALGVMHTSLPDTEAALPLLLEQASMPVMVYPEAGYFRPPTGSSPRSTPAALAEAAMGWVARGVRVVGGCCGLGPGAHRGRWPRPSRAVTPWRPAREIADAAASGAACCGNIIEGEL